MSISIPEVAKYMLDGDELINVFNDLIETLREFELSNIELEKRFAMLDEIEKTKLFDNDLIRKIKIKLK